MEQLERMFMEKLIRIVASTTRIHFLRVKEGGKRADEIVVLGELCYLGIKDKWNCYFFF